MRFVYAYLFSVLWVGYLVYWQIMADNVKSTVRLEPAASRIRRTVLFCAGVILLLPPAEHLGLLDWHFLQASRLTFFLGAAVTAAGLFFSIWARVRIAPANRIVDETGRCR